VVGRLPKGPCGLGRHVCIASTGMGRSRLDVGRGEGVLGLTGGHVVTYIQPMDAQLNLGRGTSQRNVGLGCMAKIEALLEAESWTGWMPRP